MKALFNVSTIALSLALSFSAANAMGMGQVKENYEAEAAATLEFVGINSSDYYIECTPSKDGEIAICNALASSETGRDSISMYGERTYYGENGAFTGIHITIRPQDSVRDGSAYRY